ncbi:MAG: DUF3852 domain-containing protein [Clostridia bacterium]
MKINKLEKFQRVSVSIILATMMTMLLSTSVFATGDVAGAIEGAWGDASSQIITVVDNVVFPAIDMILAIFLFVKIATNYFEYKKHGQFEFTAPAILFVCLIFTLTAPLYLWDILGLSTTGGATGSGPVVSI